MTTLYERPRAMTALILNSPVASPPFYARTTVDHGRFDFAATGYGACPWNCAAESVSDALDWIERGEQRHLMVYRTTDGEAFIAEHGPWSAIDTDPIGAAAAVMQAVADALDAEARGEGKSTPC